MLEDDPLPVGKEIRRERRAAEIGHLARVAAVGVGDVDLELAGPDLLVGEELLGLRRFLGGLRSRGAPDDLRAVGREEAAAVVARGVRQTLHVLAIAVHAVKLEVAVSVRGEQDRAVARADGGLGVIGRVVGQALRVRSVGIGGEDLVAVVNRPDVAVRSDPAASGRPRPRGASRRTRCASVGKEVTAGRGLAGRHRGLALRMVDGDLENLVALERRTHRLEDQLLAVRRPVRLRVLDPVRQLPDVTEVDLAYVVQGSAGGRRRSGLSSQYLSGQATADHHGRENEHFSLCECHGEESYPGLRPKFVPFAARSRNLNGTIPSPERSISATI